MLKHKDAINKYAKKSKVASKVLDKVKSIPIVGGIIQTESNVAQLLKSGGKKFQKLAQRFASLSGKVNKLLKSKQGKKVIGVAKKLAKNKNFGKIANKIPGVGGAYETISAAAKLAKKGGYKDLNNWKKLGSGIIKTAPQTAGMAKAVNMAQKANKVFKAVKASKKL